MPMWALDGSSRHLRGDALFLSTQFPGVAAGAMPAELSVNAWTKPFDAPPPSIRQQFVSFRDVSFSWHEFGCLV